MYVFITAVCVIFLIKLRWPKNKILYDPGGLVGFTNMAAVPLFSNNNMAAVTSRENTLYTIAESNEVLFIAMTCTVS